MEEIAFSKLDSPGHSQPTKTKCVHRRLSSRHTPVAFMFYCMRNAAKSTPVTAGGGTGNPAPGVPPTQFTHWLHSVSCLERDVANGIRVSYVV